MTCHTCRFAQDSAPDPISLRRSLICHRYPPTPLIAPVLGGVGIVAHWTPTTPDSWCGEYVRAREAVE